MAKHTAQLALNYRPHGHGGARPGAGRKPKPGRRLVAHRRRERFSSARAIHITVRVERSAGRLRRHKQYQVLHRIFCKTAKPGFRICHYSVQADHIHFIVEASNRACLTRGMRSVNVTIGRDINTALDRKGVRVIADRYHEEHLVSPRKARAALAYVLNNSRRHAWKSRRELLAPDWRDPLSSARYFDGYRDVDPIPIDDEAPVSAPRTFLLQRLWRKHRLVLVDEVPGRPKGSR